MSNSELSTIIGKTMRSVTQQGRESITFESTEGETWRMFHQQNCCEDVCIEDVIGDLQDLVGKPILLAELATSGDEHEQTIKMPPVSGLSAKERESAQASLDALVAKGLDSKTDGGYPDESFTWSFYKFATAKGYVTVRWYGSSNGYYSETAEFWKVTGNR